MIEAIGLLLLGWGFLEAAVCVVVSVVLTLFVIAATLWWLFSDRNKP